MVVNAVVCYLKEFVILVVQTSVVFKLGIKKQKADSYVTTRFLFYIQLPSVTSFLLSFSFLWPRCRPPF